MMGLDLFEGEYRTNLAALLMDAEEPGEGLYLTDWVMATPDAYNHYLTDMATYKAALQLKELVDEAKAAGMDVAEEEAFYNNAKSYLWLCGFVASCTLRENKGGASDFSTKIHPKCTHVYLGCEKDNYVYNAEILSTAVFFFFQRIISM